VHLYQLETFCKLVIYHIPQNCFAKLISFFLWWNPQLSNCMLNFPHQTFQSRSTGGSGNNVLAPKDTSVHCSRKQQANRN
jgi:hypothetical protein